ncbi:MAG: UDP-N-acetylmuramoyl-tripeptide--D-alanyl-D-alanine ligase [Acidobacteria bacterium]|nr:UDP-N-acetylmuramoyl-tripeptide--D-alanyl-D-alanine ligase [Acidobacteriota bacterium]
MTEFWPWVPILTGAFLYAAWRRLLAYLRYFQQEGYEHVRFLKWANIRSLTDPAYWVAVASGFLFLVDTLLAVVLFTVGMIVLGLVQPDPRTSGKIPLKLTWRARRVLAVAMVLAAFAFVLLVRVFMEQEVRAPLVAASFCLALLPLCLIVANALLMPYERSTQRYYYAEAKRQLARVAPFVVGITGSYGKSSAKAMLAHILQFQAPTLAASGSINTVMGVTRHIREDLVPGHRYMVVEMGAYAVGSIARLCALTPPHAGLVTAVGDMHLERFGSTEAIYHAKSELAKAVPPGGILVCNADSPNALRMARATSHCRVFIYGEKHEGELDTRIEQMRFTKQGTHFVLRTRDRAFTCFTPLLGRPIILNLAGAFTMAVAVGADPEIAVASFRTLKPVSNRLEVVEDAGITWIRDAYNSNQHGFRAALEVAADLPVKRRFLVTPGCIELGAEQHPVNRSLSREAAAICDTTVVVSEINRVAFVEGHREAGREDRLVAVPNRTEAFRWLHEHLQDGDLVILENDLPDLYERTDGVFWPASAGKAS